MAPTISPMEPTWLVDAVYTASSIMAAATLAGEKIPPTCRMYGRFPAIKLACLSLVIMIPIASGTAKISVSKPQSKDWGLET